MTAFPLYGSEGNDPTRSEVCKSKRYPGVADEFRVVISGDDELDRRIGRLSLFLQDLRSFWPLVVPVVTGWWRSQFESEGAFAGRPWAPLNPDYLARKQAMGLRTSILQASG